MTKSEYTRERGSSGEKEAPARTREGKADETEETPEAEVRADGSTAEFSGEVPEELSVGSEMVTDEPAEPTDPDEALDAADGAETTDDTEKEPTDA